MDDPLVCCVVLVDGREAMVQRAIASFRAQTYERKRLLVWNTGSHGPVLTDSDSLDPSAQMWEPCIVGPVERMRIGQLRNEAIKYLLSLPLSYEGIDAPDIIAHFDSDDWSHPRRLEEQVALLQSSGKQCVGYRDILFWDTRSEGKAWRFTHPNPEYVVGASMMYRREAWEACKFDESEAHEDYHWWVRNHSECLGVSCFEAEPRMICQIHGSNTSGAYAPEKMRPPEWALAPAWDAYCRKVMAL